MVGKSLTGDFTPKPNLKKPALDPNHHSGESIGLLPTNHYWQSKAITNPMKNQLRTILPLFAGLVFATAALGADDKKTGNAESSVVGNLNVHQDFKLEKLYTVPKDKQGSWVSLCVDPKGRLIAGDQNGKLYRLSPPPLGETGAIQPEVIDLDIGGAHGLLYAFDSLYVVVNEGSRPHGLYRLRDTKGTDRFDEVKLLRKLEASGEHGAHSLVVSPDGKSLYMVVGNSSTLTEVNSSKVPKVWCEDNLIPRIRTGFMDDSMAPQGWIAKTDPDGKNWELFAAGFRNEFDLAFNRLGELFTYDADMEWDIGDPWYRPTRVNHVISGAEFGFRNGSGKWPDYYVDSFGSVLDIGPGSPTGITFGYGAKFPGRYQEALFLNDWSFGKIRALHLHPSGSSYQAEVEEFISGQPLAVTDIVINPIDGAMYFAVGGRGTQSALYRVTYVGKASTLNSKSERGSQSKRDVRHKLEQFHGHADSEAVKTAWRYLDDDDRAIRFAARTAIEWQDSAEWRDKALKEKNTRKSIAALVALARVSGKDEIHRKSNDPKPDPALQGSILESLNRISWTRLSKGDRLDLLRAYSLALIRLGRPDDQTCQALAAKFDPYFPDQSRDINVQLSNLMIYLQDPGAAAKVMEALKKAPTQQEQIEYVLALRTLKVGWTTSLREEYFKWFVDKAPNYRGGNTFASSIKTMKTEAVKGLSDSEKKSLQAILDAKPKKESPRQAMAARPMVKEWTLDELVPIVERGLKTKRNFERGRSLYGEVSCASCHRFVDDGGLVGPDLSAVSGRFSVRDLLESVIEPSKVISDQYAAIIVHKKNGDSLTGRVGNLNGENLNIIEDMYDPGAMTNVSRKDIESIETSKLSMMPEGLLNSLKPDEIEDLVAYLLSRGDSKNRLFR